MRPVILILILSILLVLFPYCKGTSDNQGETAQEKREIAIAAVNRLVEDTHLKVREEKYKIALDNLEKILKLCREYGFKEDFIFSMIDYKQFVLQKLERFDDAVDVAFELEEMNNKRGKKGNPWIYLKIADCRLGQNKQDEALDWIRKAVEKRGFIKYQHFLQKPYDHLRKNMEFQRLMTVMKNRIGLGQSAKDFTIPLMNGGEFTLSSHRGKVVLIDFWYVNCNPCIEAFPELRALYDTFKERNFEIIGISLDTDRAYLENFLTEKEVSWPIGCTFKGWEDDTVRLYNINATPSTWLVDRKGILRQYNLRGDNLKAAVEELLAE